ncbi:MAG TPA: proline racemase family protein, partial [Gemmataceae bacterium]|nr:proline racemase family protein [Gemmataceae bacterium]
APEPMVGALLCKSTDPSCETGVIYFNNAGYLGMCGHGTIGLAVTLAYMGRIKPGLHKLDTPVGIVTVKLHDDGKVTVRNVPSYRIAKAVPVEVPGYGTMHGDIAWGGNWFFLVNDHGQEVSLNNLEKLNDVTWKIRQTLNSRGITGQDGGEIDHIELFAPSPSGKAHSKNFVHCPGKAYDRSPCGTGTSAKLACLHADGKIKQGDTWRQESIVGSIFEGSVEVIDSQLYPSITGDAHIMAEATLILDERDPFCMGIRA